MARLLVFCPENLMVCYMDRNWAIQHLCASDLAMLDANKEGHYGEPR